MSKQCRISLHVHRRPFDVVLANRQGYLRFYPGIENLILPMLSYPGRQVTSCEIAS